MRYLAHASVINVKRLFFAVLIGYGLYGSAVAQSQLPDLPALPGLPSLPGLASSEPTPAGSENVNNSDSPSLPSLPTASALPEFPATLPEVNIAAPATTPMVESLTVEQGVLRPPPPEPESTEISQNQGSGLNLPPLDISALPVPSMPITPNADDTPYTAMPLIKVVREKAPVKSWQTTLAPAIIPPKMNFNYKRDLLPERIYAKSYSRENKHLPKRMTREDYEGLLFNSVAHNDVETTRSLLNVGISLSATNPYGETPLMLAERLGSRDVAALIVARGGR